MNGLVGRFGYFPRQQMLALEKYANSLLAPKVHPTRRRSRRPRIAFHPYDLDFSGHQIKLTRSVRLYRYTNGRWYVRFTLNGKRRMLSTGETDKTHALLKFGEIVKAAERADALGFQAKSVSTFRELAEEYIVYAEVNKATSTFKGDKRRLPKLLAVFGALELTDMTQRRIELFIEARGKEVKPATVNRDLALIKHMLSKAVDWGYLKSNPVKRVRFLKEPPGRTRYLNENERERLLDACKHSESEMLYPIVLTALLTGMRKGELLALTWDDVNLTEARITVRRSKNNETRHIPIHASLLEVLSELHTRYPFSQYVFSKPDGRPYGNWRRAFDTACRHAGITNFRFHDLRHTFGSYLGMEGFNAYTIMQLMGHKTLAMSARYTHISETQLRAAIDKIGEKWWRPSHQELDNLHK